MENSQICELPYYPAIVTLGAYTREMKTYAHIKTCIQISIADNMKKKRKRPKCPLTGEWINKIW